MIEKYLTDCHYAKSLNSEVRGRPVYAVAEVLDPHVLPGRHTITHWRLRDLVASKCQADPGSRYMFVETSSLKNSTHTAGVAGLS